MDVYDAVRTVLAVRAYQDKPLPAELIRKIVEAGRMTASASNLQPWHFIAVEDRETLSKLGQLAATGHYITQAPFVVAVAIENTKFAVSDASRAVQSMILTAWADGVGSNWVGFQSLASVKPVLGIPSGLDVLCLVSFGYPVQKVGQGIKQRKPLNEVVSRDRFGQPFE